VILSIETAILVLKEYEDSVDEAELTAKIQSVEKSIERGSGYTAPTDGSDPDPNAIELAKLMLIQAWDGISTEIMDRRITYLMIHLKTSLVDGGIL